MKAFINRMREDVQTVFRKDPAARSALEVLTCYPGLHALWMHRIAHGLWRRGWLLTGRLVSHFSRFLTQIEIHPGARIGRRVFIDHGAGVVIGETAEIGDDVLLYQGVVLGGVSLKKEKRHPTIEAGVLVGAGAIILGPIRIGACSRIGAASLVVQDVPPHAIAVGVPARIGIGFSGKELQDLEHNRLPDPVAEAFRLLSRQIELLEGRTAALESEKGIRVELDRYVEEKKREIRDMFSDNGEFSRGAGI
jgi:serine O-acetyltransferase